MQTYNREDVIDSIRIQAVLDATKLAELTILWITFTIYELKSCMCHDVYNL